MFAAALVEKLSTILMGKNPQIWILALYILEKKCLYEYNHEIIFEHLDMNHDTITLQLKTNILLRTAIFAGQLIFLKKNFLQCLIELFRVLCCSVILSKYAFSYRYILTISNKKKIHWFYIVHTNSTTFFKILKHAT